MNGTLTFFLFYFFKEIFKLVQSILDMRRHTVLKVLSLTDVVISKVDGNTQPDTRHANFVTILT